MISAQEYLQYRATYKKLNMVANWGIPVLAYVSAGLVLLTQNLWFVWGMVGAPAIGIALAEYNDRRYGKKVGEFARFAINDYLRRMNATEI